MLLRNLAVALVAVVSLGVASIPTGALAFGHGGGGGGGQGGVFGGGGHGGFGGGFSHGGFSGGFGGRSLGSGFAPGIASRGIASGNTFVGRGVPGNATVGRGVPSNAFVGRNFVGNGFARDGRFAFINGHRFHGRRLFGFIPGFGYSYYWYDDGCYAWTDSGYVDLCYPYDYPG